MDVYLWDIVTSNWKGRTIVLQHIDTHDDSWVLTYCYKGQSCIQKLQGRAFRLSGEDQHGQTVLEFIRTVNQKNTKLAKTQAALQPIQDL